MKKSGLVIVLVSLVVFSTTEAAPQKRIPASPKGSLHTKLDSSVIAELKEHYSDTEFAKFAGGLFVGRHPRVGKILGAYKETFYEKRDFSLDKVEREKIIISILAIRSEKRNLGIHIYLGIMLGLTTEEIADILMVTIAYNGFPTFANATDVFETTLRIMRNVALKNPKDQRGPEAIYKALDALY